MKYLGSIKELCNTPQLFIENSGDYTTFSPEFSDGQFGKTNDAINRIVYINDLHSVINIKHKFKY